MMKMGMRYRNKEKKRVNKRKSKFKKGILKENLRGDSFEEKDQDTSERIRRGDDQEEGDQEEGNQEIDQEEDQEEEDQDG